MLSSTATSKVTELIFACIIGYTHYIRGMLASLLESRLFVLYKKQRDQDVRAFGWFRLQSYVVTSVESHSVVLQIFYCSFLYLCHGFCKNVWVTALIFVKSTCCLFQGLEDGIARHQSTVNAMNTAGQEIISKSTTIEAEMLRDKLATQNRRWESICNHVTDRRDR